MLKNRLIPVVLMRHGVCVQSKGFRRYQRLGNPTQIVERLSDWASDELIYIDISRGDSYDLGRDDLHGANQDGVLGILDDVSKNCFMPLTFGGGIRSEQDIADRIQRGADKVILNTATFSTPNLIDQAAKTHGSQAVVVCIDVLRNSEGECQVYSEGGRQATQVSPAQWAREVVERGAGELLVQSIDRDGRGRGYDLDLIHEVAQEVAVPVIALGGVGEWQHFADAIEAGADAVAAANIFNYTENSVYKAKRFLWEAGLNFREPRLGYSPGQTAAA